MPLLSEIFFDYESSGRVAAGWQQIQALGDLSHWDVTNTVLEGLNDYRDAFQALEKRKERDEATVTP
jgi:hypothetical protein